MQQQQQQREVQHYAWDWSVRAVATTSGDDGVVAAAKTTAPAPSASFSQTPHATLRPGSD